VLAVPLLVREIHAPAGCRPARAWRDVTSVYGYAGPIANTAAPPDDVARRFSSFLSGYFQANGVVSALSRMHPLLRQETIFRSLGEVVQVGWTLSIDLTLPEQEQLAAYRRNHRKDIKKLEAMGVTCEEVGPEHAPQFADIYYENMDRVGAAPEYYFTRSHLGRLLTDMPGVAHLFMCSHEGAPIAAGIFMTCRGIVQWYLAGSRSSFEGPPPSKLMVHTARRWAVGRGDRVLHLGGGVGGKRDSLHHFKRGFTQREHVYSIWKYVVDQQAYDELSRLMCETHGVAPDDGYFPLYRHPAFQRPPAGRETGGQAQCCGRSPTETQAPDGE